MEHRKPFEPCQRARRKLALSRRAVVVYGVYHREKRMITSCDLFYRQRKGIRIEGAVVAGA